MKISELLSDESKWTKNTTARDINDCPTNLSDNTAVSFCLIGAAYKCAKGQFGLYDEILNNIRTAINIEYPNKSYLGVSSFNDDPSVTFEDIKKVLKRANL